VPNLYEGSLQNSTVLWVGFKTPVSAGAKLFMHCRHCNISEVIVFQHSP
jgi:hypothetical protein